MENNVKETCTIGDNVNTSNEEPDQYNFENAIKETGFGKYNVMLIVMCGLAILGFVSESFSLGYIIPAASCELELTTNMKGVLASIYLGGILIPSQFWGYLGDVYGRRKTMMWPTIFSAIVTFFASVAVDYYWLVTLRFIGGLLNASSASIVFAYISEFHSSGNRQTVLTFTSSFVALASVTVPGMAWIILPMNWSFYIRFMGISYTPWRLLIALCGLPNLIFGLMLLSFPESPRYLIQMGQSEKALSILRNMYTWNTGNENNTFPVKQLIKDEDYLPDKREGNCFKNLYKQTIPIFLSPFWTKTLLMCTLQFGAFYSGIGFYNWIPNILNEFLETENSITICELFNNHTNGIIKINDGIETDCTPSISAVMLQYSFIFGSLRFINYLIVGLLVKRIGSKKILIFWFFVCMLSCGLMHTTQSKWITITLVCICVMSGITVGVINSFTPDMYPTKYRATAISITYMFGRIGGVLGSVIMGNLLESQCSLTFYFSAGVLLVCGVLAFQLPSNKKS